jgi:hypothetical protein
VSSALDSRPFLVRTFSLGRIRDSVLDAARVRVESRLFAQDFAGKFFLFVTQWTQMKC